MFKWNALTTTHKIAVIGILVSALTAILGFLVTSSNGITQTTNDGDAIVHMGNGDVKTGDTHIGQATYIYITPEAYEQTLNRRKSEVLAELEHADAKDRPVLELGLSDIQQQLQNKTASYEAHIASLRERIVQLEKLRGDSPDALLDQAIEALRQGENKEADHLFQQIEENDEKHIKRAAEAAYQRGKIAEDAIQYLDALKHFEKAARLSPDNTLYLNKAGSINEILASHKKAIDYYEQALASDLKTYGEDHPSVASIRNNLGGVWKSLGKYEKAIGYLEQALASGLETYGEDHPSVASIRNNLGRAWDSLGEYQKAIGYFEQALASDLKTYGENHPQVAIYRNNLGLALHSLGKYE